jgi:hypothetical protein
MEQSSSWKVNGSVTGQEIPHNLWNPKFHHSFHNSPPFRDSSWTSWPFKMGPIRCPETSIKDYHSTLRNVPEERRSPQPAILTYLNQIDPVHALPKDFLNVFNTIPHLRLGLSSGLFPSWFRPKILYRLILPPIRNTCSAHLIFPILLPERYMNHVGQMAFYRIRDCKKNLRWENSILENVWL